MERGGMAEVVLVHGAWHGAWCWDSVVAELNRVGVASTAVELPLTGIAADVAEARAAIEAAGPGSVVVGHSYGGSVISLAAAGVPGIGRLIYLAAFLAEPDADTLAMITPELGKAIRGGEGGAVPIDPAAAADVFYGDADPGVAASMVARLRPLTLNLAASPDAEPAWKSVPATYVVCASDRAIQVSAQREMAMLAETVVEWPTDHSPFLTRPAAVAELAAGYLGGVGCP
jgi:pimeloyl-ACP methyl ester carboxylesterase